MRKKIIIILGIFLSCITTKVSAMTIGEENNNKITNTNIEEKEIVEGYIDGRLRSLQLPTSSLDLSDGYILMFTLKLITQ